MVKTVKKECLKKELLEIIRFNFHLIMLWLLAKDRVLYLCVHFKTITS